MHLSIDLTHKILSLSVLIVSKTEIAESSFIFLFFGTKTRQHMFQMLFVHILMLKRNPLSI